MISLLPGLLNTLQRNLGRGLRDVALFELGAHPFLTLTLFIAMFERDHEVPLGFQLEYARRVGHMTLPYPDIAT